VVDWRRKGEYAAREDTDNATDGAVNGAIDEAIAAPAAGHPEPHVGATDGRASRQTGGGDMTALPRARVEALLREKKLDGTLTSAWSPEARTARAARLVSIGWPEIDAPLGGGFPRGECSEIVGARSTGRTTVLCALLAAATARGDLVALVDTCDRLDPLSAAGLGLDLDRLLWVRGFAPEAPDRGASPGRESPGRESPGRESLGRKSASSKSASSKSTGKSPASAAPASRASQAIGSLREQVDLQARRLDRAIKAFGLILQAGGFGVVALDLADVPLPALRRLPFTTWRRLQRLLDGHETVGVLLAAEPLGRSARGVTLRLLSAEEAAAAPHPRDTPGGAHLAWMGDEAQARVFAGFALHAQVHSAQRLDERLPGLVDWDTRENGRVVTLARAVGETRRESNPAPEAPSGPGSRREHECEIGPESEPESGPESGPESRPKSRPESRHRRRVFGFDGREPRHVAPVRVGDISGA
jgi:hypothetical protein